ncbi:MAG: PA0069 family radical SAM protein [Terrimicrobiaceae bacterium]
MSARGTRQNPANRFERLHIEPNPEDPPRDLRTEFLVDASLSIITTHDSPDLSFKASVNPYRGCEHGCPYCYARPYHEFLGLSAGLDFEQKILVKPRAAELLRTELASKKWVPQPVAMSGVTDCYQPVERRLELTRTCLKVLADFGNPVGVVTKNHLVTRDADILAGMASFSAASVHMTITTMDSSLARKLEPRASSPQHRLDAIAKLSSAGIPVGVLIAPVIPGLNEQEIPQILRAARSAGATRANYSILRLPHGVADIFLNWVTEHLPEARARIEGRIREVRDGQLNDSRFGSRMRGEGAAAERIRQMFRIFAAREGFRIDSFPLSTARFTNPDDRQLRLF